MPKYPYSKQSKHNNSEKPSPAKMEQMHTRFNNWREEFQNSNGKKTRQADRKNHVVL